MLATATITPIIHVEDLDRARRFYTQVLGLSEDTVSEAQNPSFSTGNGGHLELQVHPDSISREATALTFEVEDVEREVKDLSGRGARFEHVDVPGASMSGEIATIGNERAAWLKDSEGNWLCVHDRGGARAGRA